MAINGGRAGKNYFRLGRFPLLINGVETGNLRKISRQPRIGATAVVHRATHNKEAGMSQKKAVLSRRNFLLTVGAGSAATAAAIVGRNASTPPASGSKDKRATSGYKVSEHVTNYYRTAKV
jgi:hypothetical protein